MKLTVRALAKSRGMADHRPLRRILIAKHDADMVAFAAGRGPEPKWLVRTMAKRGSGWRVNFSLLRRFHPDMFESADPADVDERVDLLENQIDTLAQSIGRLTKFVKAIAKAVGVAGV